MTDSAAITDRERDLRELVEAQAALASFIYVDLVNLGVLERSSAAARLKLLGGVLRSGAPESASAPAFWPRRFVLDRPTCGCRGDR
jgi:hypothetical protein